MGQVSHDGGQSVSSVQVEYLSSLDGSWRGAHEDLVIVGGILTRQTIVSHLIQLSILGGGGVQIEKLINSDEKKIVLNHSTKYEKYFYLLVIVPSVSSWVSFSQVCSLVLLSSDVPLILFPTISDLLSSGAALLMILEASES